MAYNDLREWIAALERAGELKRVRAEVDPVLEITEITDRVSKAAPGNPRSGTAPGGPALLFENVKGHPGSQVLINQFGSARRMNMALGVDSLDEIADRLRVFLDVKSPAGIAGQDQDASHAGRYGQVLSEEGEQRPLQGSDPRGTDFSLLDFPVLQCWPQDAGRFITLPCVITRDPRTGSATSGCIACRCTTNASTGMHWQRQKVAAEHYRESLRAWQPQPDRRIPRPRRTWTSWRDPPAERS